MLIIDQNVLRDNETRWDTKTDKTTTNVHSSWQKVRASGVLLEAKSCPLYCLTHEEKLWNMSLSHKQFRWHYNSYDGEMQKFMFRIRKHLHSYTVWIFQPIRINHKIPALEFWGKEGRDYVQFGFRRKTVLRDRDARKCQSLGAGRQVNR